MWSRNFATRRGVAVVEVLQTTGFKKWSDFIEETSVEERLLIIESIRAHAQQQRSDAGGGGSGLPGGGAGGKLPGGMGGRGGGKGGGL